MMVTVDDTKKVNRKKLNISGFGILIYFFFCPTSYIIQYTSQALQFRLPAQIFVFDRYFIYTSMVENLALLCMLFITR